MVKKRPEFSFPELEHRGRNAILRTSAEVAAEEVLLAVTGPESSPVDQSIQERSTRRSPKRPDAGAEPSSPPTDPPRPMRAHTRASKAVPSSVVTDRLRQKLRTKQHLSSYTFRFRPEELDQLDRLVAELNLTRTAKLSKNDLVRLALGWLLVDYDEYGPESLVVEVTRHE